MPRFLATLLGSFAAASFALALAGIYAVMSASVAERRREIGVRVALGARSADLTRLIGGDAMVLAGAGLVIGATCAIAVARTLRTLLFDVQPVDAISQVTVALLVFLAAVAGSILPVRRALRIDPAEIIRD
jgi:ABC-type antimicrobial peptide transport system permease subunit